jgi:hypothetical protein
LLLPIQVVGAVENTHHSSCARRQSHGGEGGIGDVRVVYLVEILGDLVLDGVKWRKIYAVPIGYRVNLTREVPVYTRN